ncbi:MbtH family protein [Streptomyces sp. NPDC048257]|uniref:MbtH family protein n=1 Tax=Streptomyces sp. NPDC048257 TaxID=3365526 RepID=UPI0037233958
MPFGGESASYSVLVNGENQHSLWSSFAEVPAGWTVAFAKDSRQVCLEYVKEGAVRDLMSISG